jgi:hypothetical protein
MALPRCGRALRYFRRTMHHRTDHGQERLVRGEEGEEGRNDDLLTGRFTCSKILPKRALADILSQTSSAFWTLPTFKCFTALVTPPLSSMLSSA